MADNPYCGRRTANLSFPLLLPIIACITLCSCNRTGWLAVGASTSVAFAAESAEAVSTQTPVSGGESHVPSAKSSTNSNGSYIGALSAKALDVVIVIQRSDPETMHSVRAKLVQLFGAIHRLTPTARVGLIAYDGGELNVLVFNRSVDMQKRFLSNLGNPRLYSLPTSTVQAIRFAVDGVRWQSGAAHVIVWVTSSGPSPDSFEELRSLITKFHATGGRLNIIDSAQPSTNESAAQAHPQTSPDLAKHRAAMLRQLAQAGGGALRPLEISRAHPEP